MPDDDAIKKRICCNAFHRRPAQQTTAPEPAGRGDFVRQHTYRSSTCQMPKTEQVLSIFLASPGDVSDERGRVDAFVDEWNNLWSEDLGVHLRLVKWETHAYPAVGADGQDVINTQIGEEYDLFLGIMWKRFGTPTGRAASGTVEEFERALARYRASGNPQLMFYFKKVDSDAGDNAAQLQAVQQFRDRLAKKDGVLYWDFVSPDQFGQLVRVHLTRHIQNWSKRYRQRPEIAPAAQSDLANRFNGYLNNSKKQSGVLSAIILQFAKIHRAFIIENSRRAAKVRAMSDEQLTAEFQMLSLIEMANAMNRYADAAERFETSFISEFSIFVEGVLGAAAISIAFPAVQTKSLSQMLVRLRRELHPVYGEMGNFIAQLAKCRPQLSGQMLTANERSIAALGRFREHVRFGERMLLESENLFNAKHRP
ncbi:hypothetical protein [Castellaniella defragrans]|uniref:hypothetical protein n=1 Tax=Castellaniella defragrans TaxID=75697 RepID=UPI0011DD15F7|nr:hypothetical protein [Castellaniella defragrans]